VLTDEGLATIVRAIVVSRQIVQRMKNYLIYRIACTMQLLLFFFLAAVCIAPTSYHQARADSDEPPWPDFFDLPVRLSPSAHVPLPAFSATCVRCAPHARLHVCCASLLRRHLTHSPCPWDA